MLLSSKKPLLSLCFLYLFFQASLAHANGIEKLRRFFETTHAIRANFSQVVIHNGSTQHSSGKMAFSRPGKFRWEIEKPYPQLLTGNGETLSMYDPDLQQVTIKKLESAIGGTPVALLAGEVHDKQGRSTLEKNFTLAEGGQRDGLTWVDAKPHNKENGFEIVRIGFLGNELKAMELIDSFGQLTELRFSKLEYNPTLPAQLFSFTPPAGVDVIRE